jgi:ParB/RepB/Spo0J family partition protein
MNTRTPTPDILGNIMAHTTGEEFSRENFGALVWLPVGRVYDNPFQTRQAYDDEHIARLAESIWSLREELPATLGMQQPPVARVVVFGPDGDEAPLPREEYADPGALRRRLLGDHVAVQLHFGHNRLRAWRLLRERDAGGYGEFPVFVAYAADEAMWRHAVAENAQRKDISPLEEALSIRQAMQAFSLTQERAGEPFGYAKSTVANKLRLLDLPDDLRAAIADGRLSERHGRELLRLAPAPHFYAFFHPDRVAQFSVRELEKEIDKRIHTCLPLPKTPRTGYQVFSVGTWRTESSKELADPPPWPLDWAPSAQVEGIVGACEGCRFYATFGVDAGARCTEALSTCMDAKKKRWNVEQAQRQQAALQAAPPSAPAQARVEPAPPPITRPDKKLVEYTEEDWAQAKAAEASTSDKKALSGAAPQNAPAAPIHTDLRTIDVEWFTTRGYGSAPAALLEKGLCTAERCKCLVLAYHPDPKEDHVRPDAEHAPNMCYGCTSTQRLANRKQEFEHGDVTALRKRVKAEQEEAERLLGEAFATYTADELWHNRMFILRVIEGADIPQRYKAKDVDLAGMQSMLFFGAAAATCKRWDGSTQKWDLVRVQTWLAELAAAAGRQVVELPRFDMATPDADVCRWRPVDSPRGTVWQSDCGREVHSTSMEEAVTSCWKCGKPIHVEVAAEVAM